MKTGDLYYSPRWSVWSVFMVVNAWVLLLSKADVLAEFVFKPLNTNQSTIYTIGSVDWLPTYFDAINSC